MPPPTSGACHGDLPLFDMCPAFHQHHTIISCQLLLYCQTSAEVGSDTADACIGKALTPQLTLLLPSELPKSAENKQKNGLDRAAELLRVGVNGFAFVATGTMVYKEAPWVFKGKWVPCARLRPKTVASAKHTAADAWRSPTCLAAQGAVPAAACQKR